MQLIVGYVFCLDDLHVWITFMSPSVIKHEESITYLADLSWLFEYHLVDRSDNVTKILHVRENENVLGNRVYVIGYRIVHDAR